MTQEEKCLHVYDLLRQAHNRVREAMDFCLEAGLPDEVDNAVEGMDSVLYLAEGQVVRCRYYDAPERDRT